MLDVHVNWHIVINSLGLIINKELINLQSEKNSICVDAFTAEQ